jgi:hypothetical protein
MPERSIRVLERTRQRVLRLGYVNVALDDEGANTIPHVVLLTVLAVRACAKEYFVCLEFVELVLNPALRVTLHIQINKCLSMGVSLFRSLDLDLGRLFMSQVNKLWTFCHK